MDSRVIPAIIGAILLLLGAIGVLIYLQMRGPIETAEADRAPVFDEMEGPSIDSGARIEIERLRSDLQGMTERLDAMQREIDSLEAAVQAARQQAAPAPTQPQEPMNAPINQGPGSIADAYAQVVLIANRREVNGDLRIASPSYLTGVFGMPRENLTDDCQPMTNPRLRAKLRTEQVGPVRVRMLEPALASLRSVFERIEEADPDLYRRINTAGALCVRRIRGSTRVSTHAFGLSLDLNIDGKLDRLGDGRTQLGLTILADFFRDEGWYWGASFGREDSMHFEVSRDLVEKWISEGKL